MGPLRIEVMRDKLYIKEKGFEVKVSRKIEMSKEDFKKLEDEFGTNSFCPPGTYYVFYRLRKDGDRLELCQTKPLHAFTWDPNQGVLYSPKGTKRTNIQIHLGTKSKGCILIDEKYKEKYFELLKIVSEALSCGRDVIITLDNPLEFYREKFRR